MQNPARPTARAQLDALLGNLCARGSDALPALTALSQLGLQSGSATPVGIEFERDQRLSLVGLCFGPYCFVEGNGAARDPHVQAVRRMTNGFQSDRCNWAPLGAGESARKVASAAAEVLEGPENPEGPEGDTTAPPAAALADTSSPPALERCTTAQHSVGPPFKRGRAATRARRFAYTADLYMHSRMNARQGQPRYYYRTVVRARVSELLAPRESPGIAPALYDVQPLVLLNHFHSRHVRADEDAAY